MYTSSSIGESSTRFGLWAGQFYAMNFIADASWYNQHGELLGSGDITFENVLRISAELQDGEMFILLRQHATHPLSNAEAISAGIDFVCSIASYAIAPGVVYALDHQNVYGRGQKVEYRGIKVEMITPESLRRLIG
jgi:hypothetical protein